MLSLKVVSNVKGVEKVSWGIILALFAMIMDIHWWYTIYTELINYCCFTIFDCHYIYDMVTF